MYLIVRKLKNSEESHVEQEGHEKFQAVSNLSSGSNWTTEVEMLPIASPCWPQVKTKNGKYLIIPSLKIDYYINRPTGQLTV